MAREFGRKERVADYLRQELARFIQNEVRDPRIGMVSVNEVEEMYRVMAIANYEDRFVIPTTHREYAENAFSVRGGCGFSFGNGCSDGANETSLFGGTKRRTIPIKAEV